mmetsp:Transcript_26441/g.38706  ORF Transcript_26441/g.38706 Transcript_26441/m.38706 type:complete len:114 (-) Transcript_26441:185-526(-)
MILVIASTAPISRLWELLEDTDNEDYGNSTAPIVGASIHLPDESGTVVVSFTMTDSDVGYCFYDLPVGTGSMVVEEMPAGFFDMTVLTVLFLELMMMILTVATVLSVSALPRL